MTAGENLYSPHLQIIHFYSAPNQLIFQINQQQNIFARESIHIWEQPPNIEPAHTKGRGIKRRKIIATPNVTIKTYK